MENNRSTRCVSGSAKERKKLICNNGAIVKQWLAISFSRSHNRRPFVVTGIGQQSERLDGLDTSETGFKTAVGHSREKLLREHN
jgi:hypothetical protein